MSGSPTTTSTRTRARDLDRSDTCAVLDTALSDGQITVDEHANRTAAAMTATTLGQLDLLVRDLQKATLRRRQSSPYRQDLVPRSRIDYLRRPDRVPHLVRRPFTPTASTGCSRTGRTACPHCEFDAEHGHR